MFGVGLDGSHKVATRNEVIEIAKNHLTSTGERMVLFEDLETGHIHRVHQVGFASLGIGGARVSGNQFSIVNLTSSSCCQTGPEGTCDNNVYCLKIESGNADILGNQGGTLDAPQGSKYSTTLTLTQVDQHYDYSPYLQFKAPAWRGCGTMKVWGDDGSGIKTATNVNMEPRNCDVPVVAEIICTDSGAQSESFDPPGPILMFTFPCNSGNGYYPTNQMSVSVHVISKWCH